MTRKKRLTIGGLYGSATTLFVCELAQQKPVIVIPNTENQQRYWRELKKTGGDVTLINEENPFYRASRIVVMDENMLLREVTQLETEIFKVHQKIDLEQLLTRLERTGYTHEENVEEENEYAARGGIVDIFEADAFPIRIELYGDRIFSIRRFDTQTQR
ncbi:MAG: hypothetical protein WBE28_08585 [bacterium]